MRTVIFANGLFNPNTTIPPYDLLVAANGGTRHCFSLGFLPQVVVGDLDSIAEAEIAGLHASGVEIVQHPARKDYTDLELAVSYALERGAQEILILGAFGERWDQTLANLLLPAASRFEKCSIRLLDGNQEVLVIRAGQVVEISGNPGDVVSLVPLGGEARGITTQGLEYPLENGTLNFGSTRGISNVLLGEKATVQLRSGLLLCIVNYSNVKTS